MSFRDLGACARYGGHDQEPETAVLLEVAA